MTSKKNAEDIFNKAVELTDPMEQAKYLDEACAGDEKLRAEVEALLKWHKEAGDFLEVPDDDPNATLETSALPECSGTVIGRYKLLEKIGEGGMATVYMAEQKHPIRRRVALKIIKLGMDTKQVIGRFEAERQALAMMDHPNIAKVLDAGTTDTGRPYFVMELVRGVAITEFCDKNHLNTQERLELFISVCQAVQHAHLKGIIHRDIKPSNIMVTLHDGQPVCKVIDFGIAKAVNQQLTEKTVFTRYSQMIGTPEYMSPEQAEMSGLDIDTRTDVFSLGVLLYELLTGTTPFDSEYLLKKGYGEMQRIIREEEPVRPSTKISTLGEALTDIAKHRRTKPELLRKLIRTDLDWIVMKTLEKDRSRRYQSPNTLAEDVQRHLGHEPVLAGPPSKIYCFKKLLLRHRTKAITGAAVAILIVAVVIISIMYIQSVGQGNEAKVLAHKEILSKAQEFRSNGKFEEALSEVTTILNSEYIGPEAQLLHARLVMELQGPEEVLEELKKLLNETDDIACQAHFLLARAYLESDPSGGDTVKEYQQKAKEHQQKGEELFSESAEAYFNRAMLSGAVNKTLEWLDKALERDPSHYPSRKARALAYYAIGDHRNMERDAVVMTSLRKWDSSGYSLMATALRKGKYFVDAVKYHDKAIELSPNEPELYDQRRQTHMRMAKYEQALSDARECIRLNPNVGMYHFHSFCALVALGRYDEAKIKYDTITNSGTTGKWVFEYMVAQYVADMLGAGLSWYPDGHRPEGAAFLTMHTTSEQYKQLAGKAKRVVVNGSHPDWSPDGKELVYSRGILGRASIEVLDLKNQQTRLLTIPGYDPAWSPDGRYIAFTRDKRGLLVTELFAQSTSDDWSFGDREVWLIKADGSEEPWYLAEGYWPSWSSDSKQVFYHSALDNMLYAVSIEQGTKPEPIAKCSSNYPTVSPDGKYVAYSDIDGKGRIMGLSENSVITSLGMPPTVGSDIMNWSPDGHELSVGGIGLWIYDLETKTASRIMDGIFFVWASWSRNSSRQFAFVRDFGGRREIWVASLDPNMTTVESLGPGLTIEEHCREMVDFLTLRINADPEDAGNYLVRASFNTCLQEYDKAAVDLERYTKHQKGNSRSTVDIVWLKSIIRGLISWGIEKYEAGAYEQSMATLTIVNRFSAIVNESNASEVAIIAMSLYRLGRDKEAQLALERLRGMFQNARNDDLLMWLCRTEKLFAGENTNIGQVWGQIELGKLDEARQLVDRIKTSPPGQNPEISGDVERVARVLALAYYERGRSANGSIKYGEAIADYEAAVRVDPNCEEVFNELGWLLAACPETELRNEAAAIENALKACKLTDWKDHRYLSTLAAIYAEIGDFDNAIEYQKKAVNLLTEEDGIRWQVACESRLKLYKSGKTLQEDDPWSLSIGGVIAHWDFEDSNGRIVRDSSGNSLDGILVGDAHIIDDPERGGQVLCLDGDQDYVDCGKDPRFDITSEITITCWIRVNRFDENFKTVISKGDNAWRLSRLKNSNQLHFACTGITMHENVEGAVNGKMEVNDGKWHQVVGVYDGVRVGLYIDGVLDVSNQAHGQMNTNTWNVWIGANEEHLAIPTVRSCRSFDGLIDDVRIYDYALTEAEIKALYEEEKSKPGKN